MAIGDGAAIGGGAAMTGSAPIRIVGGGPVSLLLRGLLVRQGFASAELACDPVPETLPPWLAQRAIALSLGSWQLLTRIAHPPPSAPITTVEVTLRGAAGRTRLTAEELRAPALGHVVRYEALHRALREGLDRIAPPTPSVPSAPSTPSPFPLPPSLPEPLPPSPPSITVIADGNPGEDGRSRDFDQAALLATVRVSRPQEGVAFERFTDEGPLALLPLPESGLWSLVWCAPTAVSTKRLAMPAPALAALLRERFGPSLGELDLADAPQLAPLHRRLRAKVAGDTEVAIGNAAQALHPVAGQGMNLGFRDAFALAQRLGDARARGEPPAAALRGFAGARRADRFATVAVTDALATIFTAPLLHPLESVALGALDLAGPARRTLARAFMFGLRA